MISENSGKANKNKMLWYNRPSFKACKLTYFLIRLIYHRETQSKRFKNSFYGQQSDSLWWLVSAPEIFSEDQPSHSSQSSSSPFPEKQSVQYCGGNLSASLSYHLRSRTDRDFSSPQTQWCVSISDGAADISESDHVTTFPFAHGARSSASLKKIPRQDAFADESKTFFTQKGHFRFGLNSSHFVWKTRTCDHRLQSPEERPTLLPSFTLLQRDHKRFLAWGITAWRYAYGERSFRASEDLFPKASLIGQNQDYQGRQRFLRPQDCRISGVREGSFCARGQSHTTHEKETAIPHLQDLHIWDRDIGVYLSTDQMEKDISFYRHPAANSRRTFRATQSFFDGQIQLPSYRDELKNQSIKRLEILQCSGSRRADYQRTQSGLSVSKDSDQTLCGQRDLFSSSAICLQSGQLVQTPLLAKGISENVA